MGLFRPRSTWTILIRSAIWITFQTQREQRRSAWHSTTRSVLAVTMRRWHSGPWIDEGKEVRSCRMGRGALHWSKLVRPVGRDQSNAGRNYLIPATPELL